MGTQTFVETLEILKTRKNTRCLVVRNEFEHQIVALIRKLRRHLTYEVLPSRPFHNGTPFVCGNKTQEPTGYCSSVRYTTLLLTRLQTSGLKGSECVGVLAKNSLEYVYICGAAVRIGAMLLPINWRLSNEEVKYIISDGSPEGLELKLPRN